MYFVIVRFCYALKMEKKCRNSSFEIRVFRYPKWNYSIWIWKKNNWQKFEKFSYSLKKYFLCKFFLTKIEKKKRKRYNLNSVFLNNTYDILNLFKSLIWIDFKSIWNCCSHTTQFFSSSRTIDTLYKRKYLTKNKLISKSKLFLLNCLIVL